MMMINRRLGEGIVINGNIRITVVKIGSGRIRLGLTAPASVSIHRLEELSNLESSNGLEVLRDSSVAEPMARLTFSISRTPMTKLSTKKRGIGLQRQGRNNRVTKF